MGYSDILFEVATLFRGVYCLLRLFSAANINPDPGGYRVFQLVGMIVGTLTKRQWLMQASCCQTPLSTGSNQTSRQKLTLTQRPYPLAVRSRGLTGSLTYCNAANLASFLKIHWLSTTFNYTSLARTQFQHIGPMLTACLQEFLPCFSTLDVLLFCNFVNIDPQTLLDL